MLGTIFFLRINMLETRRLGIAIAVVPIINRKAVCQ